MPKQQGLDRASFLSANPRCCFCNGERPTEEPDHVPARICFKRKQGPEDMEFPACVPCNRAAAASEQVTALYIRMFDHNDRNLHAADLLKLVTGVGNNAPEAMPVLNRVAIERDLTSQGSNPAIAVNASAEARLATVPTAANRHIELFAIKALYAVYYRVTGTFAGPRHRRLVTWAQIGTSQAGFLSERVAEWFGDVHVGQRKNVDLGDQFHYRHGYNAPSGILGLSMTFGRSFIFFCVLGPSREMEALDVIPPRYQPIRELGLALRKSLRAGKRASKPLTTT